MFAVSGLLLTSCNTWVGLGRDVQKMGEGMENQAYRKNGAATAPPIYNGQ